MKRLFCTDTDSGTISVLEPSDKGVHVISAIPVGNGPRGAVMFTKSGRGYISNSAGDTISEIDAISRRETSRIKVGIAPMGVGIVPGDRFALVSNSGSNYVSIVDLTVRKEIHQICVGREPRHMALLPDGTAAYVAISGSDYISKIDTKALLGECPELNCSDVHETERISVGDGAMPYSVGISPSGKLAAAANNQVSYLSIIDLGSDTITATVDVGTKGSRGVAFSPNGDVIFLTIEDTSEICMIDAKSMKVVNRIGTNPGPRGFAIDPDTFTIYAAGFARSSGRGQLQEPNAVSVISFPNFSLKCLTSEQPSLSEVKVGAGPCSVSLLNI